MRLRVLSATPRRALTMLAATAVVTATLPLVLATGAGAAPVGQGFTVSPSDLTFILKQIKIAERHVQHVADDPTNPCASLIGPAVDQVPDALTSYGVRTVSGICNNLDRNRTGYGAVDRAFPRLSPATFRDAEPVPAAFGGQPGGPVTTYTSKNTNVFDSEPRVVSNLIVDQTVTNPAAVAAAGLPVRTQGNPGVVPCSTPPVASDPADCVPPGETLFIPNVTTDVGLSPPFNGLFSLFGQFFDHGLDFASKSNGAVFVPLKADDPLIPGPDGIFGNADDLPANQRFMVLTRTQNQPGPDGVLGTADDVKNGTNRDTPWIDQSQTYASHPSHQVFLREYALDANGKPDATGRLAGSADGGMETWAQLKSEAASKLGLKIKDSDVFNIPLLAADLYGNFIPGPNGFAQYVLADGSLLEGNPTFDDGTGVLGVPVPANVRRIETAFLDDIAHNAVPSNGLTPDADTTTNVGQPQAPGTYDNELLDAHFTAGDGRTNENIGLTAIHQVFHSEHDRLVADITTTLAANPTLKAAYEATGATTFSLGERLFQAARFVTEMEYQHLVFEEFGRKVQPLIDPFHTYHPDVDPAITAEFAHAVYRFGHSMLNETIDRRNEDKPGPDGVYLTSDDVLGSRNDIPLLDGFLNPPSYTDGGPAGTLTSKEAAGSIFMGMSDQVGNEIDEFVTDTLRNNLLGLPLDLPTLNITRARDAGVPSLNKFRRSVFTQTNDAALQPYGNWVEFGQALKHPESLVNFVAAYGRHPSIVAATTLDGKRAAAQLLLDPPAGTDPATIPADAGDFIGGTGTWADAAGLTTTGVDDIDLWMGGLAERTNLFGGLLGSTFNYVFERQMTDLQNGDRFYYLARTPGLNLRAQLEGNSFAELIMRNTTSHTLKADAFATADCKFEIGRIAGPAVAPARNTGATSLIDDAASECDENDVLIKLPDGTISYRAINHQDPAGINGQAVYNGTAVGDKIKGGFDNDTFLGNEGADRIEGSDGADIALGGEGNDVITDSAGDDVPKGGPGNDAIDSGPGLDIVMAGDGDDLTNGGLNDNETFGGAGSDKVIAGAGADVVFGDSGDDWIEGGDGQDLLCGDSCAPFFDDPNTPGNDVLVGQPGENDYDAEGGDDIMHAYPAIERNAGAGGYDWISHQYDTIPGDTDLNLKLLAVGLPVINNRDRNQETEAASGGTLDDRLLGDDLVPATLGGGGLIGCDVLDQAGIDRISGLDPLLPPLTTPLADVVAASGTGDCPLSGQFVWGAGNILLGGDGSDLLEGRGADDILDGDKYLSVRLSVRTDKANPATEIGSTDLIERAAVTGDFGAGTAGMTLQQAVFAGKVDPGNIVAVREIKQSPAGANNVDTAVFSGPQSTYDVATVGGVTTVDNLGGPDGIDTLTNIECLQFIDRRVAVTPACGRPPTGTVTISDTTPTEDQTLTAVSTIADPDGIPGGITFNWESGKGGPDTWVSVADGPTFTPGDAEVGFPLRVVATFLDGLDVNNSITSAETGNVANVQDPATGTPDLSTTIPQAGVLVTASPGTIADADGLTGAFTYQWLSGPAAGPFTPIAGATAATFVPTAAQVGARLQVRVSFVDAHGTPESRLSVVTSAVIPAATAPAAPVIGTATAGIQSATVTWTAPNNGGAVITGYTVQVQTTAGVQVGALRTAPAGSTNLVVTGLTGGTAYRFRVFASNAVGNGGYSALSNTVTALAPATAPGAPTIGASTRGVGSVTANWTAPASNGGSPLTGYVVQLFAGTATTPLGGNRTVAPGVTTLTVTGLAAATNYTFQVQAVNAIGGGPFSARSAAVTTAVVPTAPALVGTPVQSNGAITVNWTAPTNTGGLPLSRYDVQVTDLAGTTQQGALRTAAANATSLAVTGLTPGTSYRFRVRAVNAVGAGPNSALSAAAGVVFAVVPGAPVNGAPVRGAAGGAVTASAAWTPPANTGGLPIQGYRAFAQRMSNGTATATPVGAPIASGNLAATARTFSFTLTAGANYRFQVEAFTAVGTGPRSALSANVVPQ